MGMLNSLPPYKVWSSESCSDERLFGCKKVRRGGLLDDGYARRAKVNGEVDAIE
jgi:hypothetical protein